MRGQLWPDMDKSDIKLSVIFVNGGIVNNLGYGCLVQMCNLTNVHKTNYENKICYKMESEEGGCMQTLVV